MKAVVTVIGKDMVGILAKVSAICADKGANVIEVTQSIMQDMFAMIMMIDISGCTVPFSALNDEFDISIPATEIIPENFNSVDAMAAMVARLSEE